MLFNYSASLDSPEQLKNLMTVDVPQEIQISKLQWENKIFFVNFQNLSLTVGYFHTRKLIEIETHFIDKLSFESGLLCVNTFATSIGKHRMNGKPFLCSFQINRFSSPPSLATSSTFCPTLSKALSISFWCFSTKGLIILW